MWCKPACRPMSLWAYHTLSQARNIMTTEMTQKMQVLHNLDLPLPQNPYIYTTHYLWTYSVFAFVCRILGAHIENVKYKFRANDDDHDSHNDENTLMTFLETECKVCLLPFTSHEDCFTIKPWLFKMTTGCREFLQSQGVTSETIETKIEEILRMKVQ